MEMEELVTKKGLRCFLLAIMFGFMFGYLFEFLSLLEHSGQDIVVGTGIGFILGMIIGYKLPEKWL